MEIICKKNSLSAAIQIVLTAISTKSSLPVLSNILFEAKEGGIVTLSATDLEVAIKTNIQAEVLKTGGITIPAKKIADITREVKNEDIKIKVDEEHIKINSGRSNFSIIGINKNDFPVIPEFNSDKQSFNIEKDVLKDMIKKTVFAVSFDETRYVLNGVYLEAEKGILKMVATDGRRLSLVENNIDKKNKIGVIIPTKGINELNRLISLYSGKEIEVGVSDNQISFKMDNIIMISKLIEGNYPNYEQIIPKGFEVNIPITKEDFLAATKRVALLSSEKMNIIKYKFDQNKIQVSASTQGVGEAQDEIDVVFTDTALEVAYNPVYIMDVLKNIEQQEIVFEVKDSVNPCIIRPKESKEYTAVIMPMRI